MNEYILNLAGFTPEEWRDFRSRVLGKIFAIWRKLSSVITVERLRNLGIVLIVLGAVFFGVRLGLRYFAGSRMEEGSKQAEPTSVSEVGEPTLEMRLEALEKRAKDVLKANPDYSYPTLDFQLDLVD